MSGMDKAATTATATTTSASGPITAVHHLQAATMIVLEVHHQHREVHSGDKMRQETESAAAHLPRTAILYLQDQTATAYHLVLATHHQLAVLHPLAALHNVAVQAAEALASTHTSQATAAETTATAAVKAVAATETQTPRRETITEMQMRRPEATTATAKTVVGEIRTVQADTKARGGRAAGARSASVRTRRVRGFRIGRESFMGVVEGGDDGGVLDALSGVQGYFMDDMGRQDSGCYTTTTTTTTTTGI